MSTLTRFDVVKSSWSFGQSSRLGGSNVAGPLRQLEVDVARRRAVRQQRHRLGRGVRRVVDHFHVEHGGQAAEALRADAERIHLLEQLEAQLLGAVLRAARLELVHVHRLHHRPLGHQHRLLGRAADAEREHPRRAPVSAHGRHDREHPVDDRVVRQEHRELRLVLRAAALRGDDHLDLVARHQLDVRHARGVVLRVDALAVRVGEHRAAQLVLGVRVRAPHAFVDHFLERQLRLPAHVHAHPDERDADPGVLAHRPMALGAHARVDEDLRDRVLRRGRGLALVRLVEVLQVVGRVVVRDELERVGDGLDEIFLLDDGHEAASDDGVVRERGAGNSRLKPARSGNRREEYSRGAGRQSDARQMRRRGAAAPLPVGEPGRLDALDDAAGESRPRVPLLGPSSATAFSPMRLGAGASGDEARVATARQSCILIDGSPERKKQGGARERAPPGSERALLLRCRRRRRGSFAAGAGAAAAAPAVWNGPGLTHGCVSCGRDRLALRLLRSEVLRGHPVLGLALLVRADLAGVCRLRRGLGRRGFLRVGQRWRRQLGHRDAARHRERNGDCNRTWCHVSPLSCVGSRPGPASGFPPARRPRTSGGSCRPSRRRTSTRGAPWPRSRRRSRCASPGRRRPSRSCRGRCGRTRSR